MPKSDIEKESIIQEFCEMTDLNENISKEILEKFNYDIGNALNNYKQYMKKNYNYLLDDMEKVDLNIQDQTEYYAGGSANSGLNIIDPETINKKSSNSTSQIDHILNKAKNKVKHENMDDFVMNDSSENTHDQKHGDDDTTHDRTIHMICYSNGFTLGDDERFFSYDSQEAKKILSDMQDGYLSRDILNIAGDSKIKLVMSERRHEEFVQSFKAFSGKGQMLGTHTPKFISSNDIKKEITLHVDDSLPVGYVRIRLVSGKVVNIKVNPSIHTVRQLYDTVSSMTPTIQNFSIYFSYPSRKVDLITEGDKTIEAANILECSLIQKLD